MTARPERQIDQLLSNTAAEYLEEERDAAQEEAREASAVFSVRLPADTYDAVRAAADRAHLTPSALIRQWVAERIADASGGDLAAAVAALRRDIDRVADLAHRS